MRGGPNTHGSARSGDRKEGAAVPGSSLDAGKQHRCSSRNNWHERFWPNEEKRLTLLAAPIVSAGWPPPPPRQGIMRSPGSCRWKNWHEHIKHVNPCPRVRGDSPYPHRSRKHPRTKRKHSSENMILRMRVCVLSRVQLCETPWTVARQTPLSMGLSRQEHWSGSPFPS